MKAQPIKTEVWNVGIKGHWLHINELFNEDKGWQEIGIYYHYHGIVYVEADVKYLTLKMCYNGKLHIAHFKQPNELLSNIAISRRCKKFLYKVITHLN